MIVSLILIFAYTKLQTINLTNKSNTTTNTYDNTNMSLSLKDNNKNLQKELKFNIAKEHTR